MIRRDSKAAKRYARALFNLSAPASLAPVQQALTEFVDTWRAQPLLQAMITNPSLPEAERRAALGEIAQKLAPGNQDFANFLSLLLGNRRLPLLQLIKEEFDGLVAGFKHALTLKIVSAFALADSEKEAAMAQIRAGIPVDYAQLIETEWEVDPSIMGGLIIKSGDSILDGSLGGVLNRMAQALKI